MHDLLQNHFYYFSIFSQQPVILTGTNLVGSAYHWTLPYLCSNLGNGENTVYFSKNGKFKYFDEKKLPLNKDFIPPTTHSDMTFQDFVKKLKDKESNGKK